MGRHQQERQVWRLQGQTSRGEGFHTVVITHLTPLDDRTDQKSWESNFHFLFSTKDFDAIKKKLESKIPGEKFLASFTLEKLKKKKELDLNESELKKINEIKMLTELVPVCSGCTYWKTVPINELWNKKHPIYKSAESWFKFYYKMNYKNK